MQRSLIEKYNKAFEDIENDVNILITQIDTCFDLLIPKFKIEDLNSNDDFFFRPMQGISFSIILNNKVEITRDATNSDLIDNLIELCQELDNFYNKKFLKFYQDIVQFQAPNGANILEEILTKINCLKMKIVTIIWKFKEINIVIPSNEDNDDSDDDDFEDVPEKEG